MEVILEAVLDTIKIVPVLLLVYLILAYLESNTENKVYQKVMTNKGWAPAWGALLGGIPQCGFSVVGATLYSKKYISVGTLLAIFIATSDEAIPILFVHPAHIGEVGGILLLKIGIGITIGLLMDSVQRWWGEHGAQKGMTVVGESAVAEEQVNQVPMACAHCNHTSALITTACMHTIKVFFYLVGISVIIGMIVEWIGEEQLAALLAVGAIWQPAMAALIGLIPNCVASVLLTDLYIEGMITMGSLIGGLCTGAGTGVIMLCRTNKSIKQNMGIIIGLYSIGAIVGMLLNAIF